MQLPSLYILAGGASRRFGRDKAMEPIGGRPLVVDIVDRLRAGFADTTLVCDRPDRHRVADTRVITDDPGGIGPMGGVHAALRDRLDRLGEGWAFLASCDLVRPRPEWATPLLDARTADAEIVAYRGEKWETLFALYHTRLLPCVIEHIGHSRYALHHLCDHARSVAAPLPEGLTRIPQANTPEELRRLLGE